MKPGLVGGHCIGVDPYYLTFKSEELGYTPDLILSARQINNGMSKYIVNKTIDKMIKAGKEIINSNILILGITFKEDCPDMRNTKVIDIIDELKSCKAKVDIYDPWIESDSVKKLKLYSFINNPLKSTKKYDAIVVAVAHKQFKKLTSEDYDSLISKNGVIIDIKNIVEKSSWRL